MNTNQIEQTEMEIEQIAQELESTKLLESKESLSIGHHEQQNYVSELENKIKEFVIRTKPLLAILTPCYGGLCHSDYTLCLIDTIRLLENYGIGVKVFFCNNDSLVSRARNNLVGTAMGDKNITHFMFVDGDIVWNPIDIIKLFVFVNFIINSKIVNNINNINDKRDISEFFELHAPLAFSGAL